MARGTVGHELPPRRLRVAGGGRTRRRGAPATRTGSADVPAGPSPRGSPALHGPDATGQRPPGRRRPRDRRGTRRNGGPGVTTALGNLRIVEAKPRAVTVARTTKETDITIRLVLDGTGRASASTGVGLYDHLLTALGHHG